MKTMTYLAAIGLTSAALALDAFAAKPGRPDAFTRGIDVARAEPANAAVTVGKNVLMGRPEALTRGLGVGTVAPPTGIAIGQKTGRPEYHTRGIYCQHLGRRG